MKPLDPYGAAPRSSPRLGLAAARRTEKASPGNGLGQGQQGSAENRPRSARRLEVELVCQAETPVHDPFWDGPRLLPVFVAQVMGQVMAAAAPLPASAYEMKAPPSALLFDAKL